MDFSVHLSDSGQLGQSIGNRATFNLKVYGLLVKALWSDIPLRWLIKSGKAKEGVDFVKNVTQVTIGFNASSNTYYPVRGAWAMRTFVGSAFALPVHKTRKFLEVAAAYMKKHALSGASALRFYVMSAVQPPSASPPGLWLPVAHRIDRKPYAAVFDSTGNADIQLAILAAAGLEREQHDVCGTRACPLNQTVLTPGAQYRILSKEDAGAIDDKVCLSFASEPHFGASTEVGGATPFVNAARSFVLSGGNFLAQCHGIDTYENCDVMKKTGGTCAGGGTISESGMAQDGAPTFGCTTVSSKAGVGVEIYPAGADLPIVQFEGPWTQIGGSVTSLCDGGTHTKFYNESEQRFGFWVSGYESVKTPVVRTYHVASGTTNRSEPIGYRFFFLTGHSYKPEEAGARVYLNALLIPANRRRACGFVIEEEFTTRKRQVGAIKTTVNPGDPCGCDLVYDACGVCDGGGKVGLDGCGVCDGDGRYVDYCGTCRRNAPFYFADGRPDIGCCNDGITNQNETNVDCGGICAPCLPPATPAAAGSTPAPSPAVPVGGAVCEALTSCSACVGHPLRSCSWCGAECMASDAATCDAAVFVPSRANCTVALATTAPAKIATTTPSGAQGGGGGGTSTARPPPPQVPSDGSCPTGQRVGDTFTQDDKVCHCDGVRLLCFARTSELLPVDGGCLAFQAAVGSLVFVYDADTPYCACLSNGLYCTAKASACGLLSFSAERCNERADCTFRGTACVAKEISASATATVTLNPSNTEVVEVVSAAHTRAVHAALVALSVVFKI